MENNKPTHKKNALLIKSGIIGLMILILIIPTLFIKILIEEREETQEEAIEEVSSKWSKPQTITGPVISIPYIKYVEEYGDNNKKKITRYKQYIHILPEQLNISGSVNPRKRYRGIYEVVVYNSDLKVSGSFESIDLNKFDVDPVNIMLDKAVISFGITDLRGIENQIIVNVNNSGLKVNPGMVNKDICYSGIHAPLKLDSLVTEKIDYNLDLSIKGSEYLYFTPVGKNTKINIDSDWKDPGFDGAFLPDHRELSDSGFTANWEILHLNRNYPQSWKGRDYDLYESAFGVKLLLPVDHYMKSIRSVKYALLIIVLTFISFFIIELIFKKDISAFSYGLIGLALVLFYILLISISEHSNFDIAYLIASSMVIALITIYSVSILKNIKSIIIVFFILSVFYGFIYIILQQQDYALLMGSLGLFIILALVMYFSKKIDLKI